MSLKPSDMSDSPRHGDSASRLVSPGGKGMNNTFKSTVMDTVEEVRFDSRLSNQKKSGHNSNGQLYDTDQNEANQARDGSPLPDASKLGRDHLGESFKQSVGGKSNEPRTTTDFGRSNKTRSVPEGLSLA
jgi:hypothetical protein